MSVVVAYGQRANPATTELKTALQLKLDEWHKAGAFPGATFGVALANGESFGLAVGFSDRAAKTPMKPTDRMPAGSVGKTFAAATALQLIKEGKIGLDDKIEKYLGGEPWFARLPNARDITVRQLMNHTSGLVRYEFKEQFTKDLTANPDKVWKPAELVAYLLDEKAPFEAGKGWDYSDTNYIVLGMIIEKVTGRKFYDEANSRVLKPLKLTDTIPQDGPRLPGMVQGYAGANNPFGGTDEMIVNGEFAINPQFEWTGGGYISTAHDLARWAKMMYEGRAYSPDLLPQVVEGVAAPMLGRETKYGLGVIIRKTTLGTAYGHSGFFPGYMTDMMYFPEHKIAVAVQVNTSVGRSLGKPLSRVLLEAMEVLTAGVANQAGTRNIGSIEFYGYEGLKLDQIKAALSIHAGDPFPGPVKTREAITKDVTSAIGRPPTDISPVCCDPNGNYMIFVGLPGTSVKETKLNPVPTGSVQLPPEIVKLYDDTMEASTASVLKGNAREDVSQGYALSTTDSRLRAKQEEVRAYATKHEKLIRDVLDNSSDSKQRIVAAHLLGYANQSNTQIADLVRASHDANLGVRNNATRALGVLAESNPKVAARIPAGPFIEMINSGSWTDRNKAGWVLDNLTRSRDPKVLAQLRAEALASLIEMARWRSTGHASTARVLLGRIAGIDEARLAKLANASDAEEIIKALPPKP